MRRTGAPHSLAIAVICALVAESATSSRPTTGYSRLYVFGDSYSDIGAGYIDGNGPTAIAYLGWSSSMKIQLRSVIRPRTSSTVRVILDGGASRGGEDALRRSRGAPAGAALNFSGA
jgi:cholinesterase